MNIENLSKEFVQDLIPLVNSLGNLAKTASVKYKNVSFNYVPLDDILARIKENGNFAFMQPLGTMENGTPCIQCILIHRSGESIVSDPYRLKINPNGSKQEEGSEITYSRRYSASSFFGIASDDDNDASGSKIEPKKKSLLSDDTRNKLNSQIREYKQLTGKTAVTFALEKEIGKPLSTVTEKDAERIGNILKQWKYDYITQLETGGVEHE